MGITVKESFDYAVKEGLNLYAHTLFYALHKGKVTSASYVDEVNLSEEEMLEVVAMKEKNMLGINPINLYAIKLDKCYFAIYLARAADDAQQLHAQKFGKIGIAHDMSDKIYTEFWEERKKRSVSFVEIREKTKELPAFVCMMRNSIPRKKAKQMLESALGGANYGKSNNDEHVKSC